MTNLRVRFHVLLVITLVFLTAGVSFERLIDQTKEEFRSVQREYVNALIATRTTLAGLLRMAGSDVVFNQNLEWGLQHSVKKALDAQLQKGELDQIQLFDQHCEEIARASFGKLPAGNCPMQELSNKKREMFFWQLNEGYPVLGLNLMLSREDKTYFYLVGMVTLNDSWLNLYPILKNYFIKLYLSLKPESDLIDESGRNGVLVYDGVDKDDHAVAVLVTGQRMFQFIPVMHFVTAHKSEFSVTHAFIWLALIFSLFSLIQIKLRWDAVYTGYYQFLSWCEDLSPLAKEKSCSYKKDLRAKPLSFFLEMAKSHVVHALQTKNDMVRNLTSKKNSLEESLVAKEKQLSDYQQRLLTIAELDSLAYQVEHTAASFLQQSKGLMKRVDDFSKFLLQRVFIKSETLHKIFHTWNDGIESKGARRFMRAMFEAQGTMPGKSLLDEQIQGLTRLSSGLKIDTLDANQMLDLISAEGQELTNIATLWFDLARPYSDKKELRGTVLESISSAQRLIKLDKSVAKIVFSNLLKENELSAIPMMPKPLIISGLYHIYRFLLEYPKRSNVQNAIITRSRKEANQGHLIFFLAVDMIGKIPSSYPISSLQQRHFNIAESIVSAYGMKCSIGTVTGGPSPIVLSWPLRLSDTIVHNDSETEFFQKQI